MLSNGSEMWFLLFQMDLDDSMVWVQLWRLDFKSLLYPACTYGKLFCGNDWQVSYTRHHGWIHMGGIQNHPMSIESFRIASGQFLLKCF